MVYSVVACFHCFQDAVCFCEEVHDARICCVANFNSDWGVDSFASDARLAITSKLADRLCPKEVRKFLCYGIEEKRKSLMFFKAIRLI
jgi:hypothetical protein